MTLPVPGEKNLVLGLILTFLFGPLGMLYATIVGALVMLVLGGIVGFLTAGLGLILIWPLQMFWTWSAISSHNRQLRAQFGQAVQQASRV
ncbi:hypothetical protein ACFP81_07365 [Deinococcus lacus]|uniref:Uncharacterized protein n=1 Tax=Deinococcus lacus TaxID=392561 RepID=A0ABW1YF85_9DEIO